jgi:hypothetical protein
MNAFLQFLDRRSGAILLVLTVFFLGLETYYALHRPLSHDEFTGVWSVVEVSGGVPYVDFQPYKPVLGYYVQLAFLQLATDTWSGYLAIRLGMTCLAVGTLLLGALWLRRIFRAEGVCLAYALLVVMTSLVEWAIEVRLDMLTALFGFVSLLFLLNRRVALAGALAGVSFLVSQKGTMYALAGGAALLGCLVIQRDGHRWRDVLVYAACVILPIGLYVACWSLIASFPSVVGPTFGQQTQLHALTTPVHDGPNFYWFSWIQTLLRNPLFYIYVLWALGVLLTLGRAQSPRETLLLFYGCTVALIVLSIQQPWMYMFVLIVPTAFVLHVYLFTRELAKPDSLLRRPVLWVCFVMLGLFWPLSGVPAMVHDDPGPQRQTLELATALLQPGDRYFAGFQLLYRGDAHETALGMVDTNTARPIHSLTAAEHGAILERFQDEPIRFVVYTTVIDDGVPEPVKQHLFRNYAPFWANVWIYAPQCQPTDSQVNLLFAGSYGIETEKPGRVLIDGQSYAPGDTVELGQGRHAIVAPVRLRLKLRPSNIDQLLNPAYREPISFFWPNMGPAADHIRTGVWVDH